MLHRLSDSEDAPQNAATLVTTSLDAPHGEHRLDVQFLQVAQTMRTMPLFLLFHASAALCVHNLATLDQLPWLGSVWLGAALVCGFISAFVFLKWNRGWLHERQEKMLRSLEVFGLVLGLIWALPIAFAGASGLAADAFPIAGLTLAMLGIGAVTFARVPTGATIFLALVTAALARALFEGLPVNAGSVSLMFPLMAALLCTIYGLVLVAITLNNHWDFLRRFRAEREVLRQSEVIRLLLNDFEREAQDFLFETEREGRLTYFSPRFAEALQEDAAKMRLRPLRHVLADHASTEDWRKVELAMLEHLIIRNMPISLAVGGVPVVWHITARPLYDRRNNFMGYRGVCRDVTQAEEAHRRIEAAMEASEKASAAKSQFLAVVSHELRTPINSIIGFSELLVRDSAENLPAQSRTEFSTSVLESARQLQSLINDLLDATHMERNSLNLNEREIDMAQLVEDSLIHCRDQAEKADLHISAKLTDGISVKADVVRLKQVIVNLLSNAIKFSKAGGIINIDMQRGARGEFVLEIRDAGIGIAAQDIERVFDPFVQADSSLSRRFGGMGLGLSLSRRIARLHDGDVTLESAGGSGTTARLRLPAARVTWPPSKRDAQSKVA